MPSSRPLRADPPSRPSAAATAPVDADDPGEWPELALVADKSPAVATRVRGAALRSRRTKARAAALDARFAHPDVVPLAAAEPARARGAAARACKRALDVLGALVGLVLSAPILLLLGPLVKLESAGPLIFSQMRVGRGGHRFRCYKLRTMSADAEAVLVADAQLRAAHEANGFKLPSHADRRVTPLGRLLRTTSLDELPQFWNVLRGDMSLVGPRPIVDKELGHYAPADRPTLLSVRPGITGAWAVAGRSRIGYPLRAAIELAYVREWSILGDLAILVRTTATVIGRRGAS